MRIITALQRTVQKHWVFIFPFFLFLLLIFRDPFSHRTLVPNLEPFPDSFHYLSPALSFIHGKGFFIEREGRLLKPDVPPLYSLVISPFLLLKEDVRMFYFANVFLSIAAFFLFYTLARKLFNQKITQLCLLVLYATSVPLTWFPSLAMAENMILPLFLSGILLLLEKPTRNKMVLAGMATISFYGTKYASLPLSAAFTFLYGLKMLLYAKANRNVKHIFPFLVSFIVSVGAYIAYEYVAKGSNLIGGLLSLFVAVFFPKPVSEGGVGAGGGEFFATRFIATNIRAYGGFLFGQHIQTLWDRIQTLPPVLAYPAVAGLLLSLLNKQKRFIGVSLITFLLAVIGFMMVFYAYDGRYFIIAVPAVLLGLGFFFSFLFDHAATFKRRALLVFVMLVIIIGHLGIHANDIRFHIVLNLKYAETPWYYLSVRELDTYLHNHKSEFKKKPVVISAMAPYFIDFYSKEEKILLPLHNQQDFRSQMQKAWGDHDYSDLLALYKTYLEQGHPVFIEQYGLGRVGYLHEAYNAVFETFETQRVQDGCHNLCNIDQLIRVKEKL